MKYLLNITVVVILFVGIFATTSFAQDYQLLQPLPIGGVETTNVTPSSYIEGMFMLIIGIAGVLAVIMIIVGGIKYMTTDAMGAKNDAKKTIQNAIFGLLLALGAWIILFSIGGNRFTEFNISLTQIPAGSTPPPPGSQQPQQWYDDSATRSQLASFGITINNQNCQTIGQTGCTSVYQLGGGIQFLLRDLRTSCANCPVVITGGTEYWLHGSRSLTIDGSTQHRPGGNVADIRLSAAITVFLRFQGTPYTGTSCSTLGSERYQWNGAIFVNEGSHWHVCT